MASIPALASVDCSSIEAALVISADVHASMAVIERPETCSLVVAIMDTSSGAPAPFGISLAAPAAHGEAGIVSGFLNYRRTVEGAGIETLPLRLTSNDGRLHSVTWVIRMPTHAADS